MPVDNDVLIKKWQNNEPMTFEEFNDLLDVSDKLNAKDDADEQRDN
jgi:hypothetical protein